MEDDKSTEVAQSNETPAEDLILSSLSDTEDQSESSEAVVETPNNEVSEAETKSEDSEESEVEQPIEKTDGIDTPVDPKEEARRRYEERQRVIAERKARVQEQTKDYMSDAENEYDQRLRAMEVQKYSELIESTENKLITEFERAKVNPNLQIFNPESDQFNQKIYDKALRDYNAGYVEYDRNGNMVGLKGSLYEHLTETAELFQGAIKSGQIQQVRAARQMKSNADVKPAASPKESTKDPILDILKSD